MAAYRSGDRLDDDKYGLSHDYTRRDGVEHSEIVLPANAPEWAGDRKQLWNRVEQNEKRDNAQLAREVQLSLPHELDEEQRRDLALEFAHHMVDTYGFAVDTAIHAPSEKGDDRNHHAHLLMTTRGFDDERESGWSKTKDRSFNAIAMQREGGENAIEDMREVWEGMQNQALERAGIVDEDGQPLRVDRRSYERQGLEIEPTEHEGPAATAIKRQGDHSDRAAENDEKRERNAERDELAQQIEASREAIGDELQAIHRTPDEDKIKYKFHDNEEVQSIFAEQEGERRGFAFMGGGSIAPHLFRAGHSRQLADFNAELAEDAGDRQDDGTGEDQRAPQREAQRAIDQAEEERAMRYYENATREDETPDRSNGQEGEGRGDLLQALADAAERRQAQKQRGSDRAFPTESELLDTDPRPEDFAQALTPDPEPERRGFGRGGW